MDQTLPDIIAGPILRRCQSDQVVFWLATSCELEFRLEVEGHDPKLDVRNIQVGRHLFIALAVASFDDPLPVDTWLKYRMHYKAGEDWRYVLENNPHLAYPGHDKLGFKVPSNVQAVLHGSCRKPHYEHGDGLVQADRLFEACLSAESPGQGELPELPSILLMSGDQIYGDDVAGPMLRAIHLLIEKLGVFDENLHKIEINQANDSIALYHHQDSYYRREKLLPSLAQNRHMVDMLFGGAKKPIFTTVTAHNHLMTFGEYLCMYLLVWSPTPWQMVDLTEPPTLKLEEHDKYEAEKVIIDDFVSGLAKVQRLFAHIPVAMIFDDHDLTDDWNLNREWEEAVYGHSFSRRIIGNGLMAYLLCQGWGNRPEAFSDDMLDTISTVLQKPGFGDHDEFIDQLLRFEEWDFEWRTDPPMIALDTRTRRWRSESSAVQPSGLLDWEALTDLQLKLKGKSSVMLIAPAPIFGVKLIEAIQRVFTWFGKPLVVDAENWMAHPGTANGILNIVRHSKTPDNFIVMSGDVHYSFVYDVELRNKKGELHLWQICSSGLRNEFPRSLLSYLDKLNTFLYGPSSILNLFTRRRKMRITPRRPKGFGRSRNLLNASGIGLLELDEQGRPWRMRQITDGMKMTSFELDP